MPYKLPVLNLTIYYRLLLKGTFDNKEVNKIVKKDCKKLLLKKAAKAWFAATVAVEALLR